MKRTRIINITNLAAETAYRLTGRLEVVGLIVSFGLWLDSRFK